MSKLYSQVVDTLDGWNEVIEKHCLPKDTAEICGIPVNARFEDLKPSQVAELSEWYEENGITVLLKITSEEMALGILGAEEVDPSNDRYNWVRGKTEKTYYWLARNEHNRVQTAANLGTIDKEGLVYDVCHGFMALGPTGHVDALGDILSLAHRTKSPIIVLDETGDWKDVSILVQIGCPPQLCAIFDRNAPKKGNDQEFMDRTQFTEEFLVSILGEDQPDWLKTRNTLAKNLVTVRNNLWSRLHGTGYHPSKRQQPSMREARSMQACFEKSEHASSVGNEDELQELLVRVHDASLTDDGKKKIWSDYITPPMAACMIVLASNAGNGQWNGKDGIRVDWTVAESILAALNESTTDGTVGFSSYLKEVAAIKSQPKKPSGLDKWVFWGFTRAVHALLEGEYSADEKYFPPELSANNARKGEQFITKVRKGEIAPPILGGYDCGPQSSNDDD